MVALGFLFAQFNFYFKFKICGDREGMVHAEYVEISLNGLYQQKGNFRQKYFAPMVGTSELSPGGQV